MSAKEKFFSKITNELLDFKRSSLSQRKEKIFYNSFKIDAYITLYEVLVDFADKLEESVLITLVNQNINILAELYGQFVKEHGDQYSQMANFIEKEARLK